MVVVVVVVAILVVVFVKLSLFGPSHRLPMTWHMGIHK